jgi:uncharacterized protein YbjT (DUF2867 family)
VQITNLVQGLQALCELDSNLDHSSQREFILHLSLHDFKVRPQLVHDDVLVAHVR